MTTDWIILALITLCNFGCLWVSMSYAKIAQDACKRALRISDEEPRNEATPSAQQGSEDA